MKTDLFQFCGHCWVFQICWHWCSSLTVSSFRILNSSAEIPSPPLAFLVVMLPKAHLTSHSRMFGSRWMTTPLWLSQSLRPFLYSSVFFLPLLLNLFCFCYVLAISVLYCTHPYMKCSLGISSFLEEIASVFCPFVLFLCIVLRTRFFYFSLLFCGTLHSVEYIFPFLPCLLLLFFPQLFVKPLQTTTFHSYISFPLIWFWSLPSVQCYRPPPIVL